MNHIIGLDLSLTATGIARFENGETTFTTLRSNDTGMERLLDIEARVLDCIYPHCRLVVVEGIAFSRNDPSAQERAALHYFLRRNFFQNSARYVLVPPSTLKKFVTGKGTAEKSLVMMEVYKRWRLSAGNDNEADAIGLAMIGACLLGEMGTQNEAQREVLATISASHPGMFPNIAPAAKKPKKRKKAA